MVAGSDGTECSCSCRMYSATSFTLSLRLAVACSEETKPWMMRTELTDQSSQTGILSINTACDRRMLAAQKEDIKSTSGVCLKAMPDGRPCFTL
uniref:Uncharacterized protein n=1 Tax=Arundo donax TaxID=35708 RepID=A0A0A9D1E1_ARUDO